MRLVKARGGLIRGVQRRLTFNPASLVQPAVVPVAEPFNASLSMLDSVAGVRFQGPWEQVFESLPIGSLTNILSSGCEVG